MTCAYTHRLGKSEIRYHYLDSMEKKGDYTIAMIVSRRILLTFYIVMKIRNYVINPDKGILIENVNRSTN